MINSKVAMAIKLSTLYRGVADILGLPELAQQSDKILCEAESDNIVLAKKSRMPSPIRTNYDYGEIWPKILDDYRNGKIKTIVDFVKKKRRVEKKSSYLGPIDSYCSSRKNIAYWQQLLDSSPSPAVKDFIEYIKQVSCSDGEK
jgi:hypothetical protein